MKVLRSQYLKLQNSGDYHEMMASKKNGFRDLVSSKGKEHVNSKETVSVAEQIMHRRKSITCFKLNPKSNAPIIKISFKNVDASLGQLNLVVEYTDMGSLWLTNLYKTYENDLYRKKPRWDIHGEKKWNFYCGLCSNVYRGFTSIKTHLNQHLNFYPYVCKICHNKYTGRKSATRHLQKAHHMNCQQWNDFLTS